MAENRTYDEIAVGDRAQIERVAIANDFVIFAHASGNRNPLHLHEAGEDPRETVAPSMWVGSLFSAVLGNLLPGAGTRYQSQTVNIHDRVHAGDQLTISVEVTETLPEHVVRLQCEVVRKGGGLVCDGEALVVAPTEKQHIPDSELPRLTVQSLLKFEALEEHCAGLDPLATAVVFPTDEASLGGPVRAALAGLIRPILVGPRQAIQQAAEADGADIGGYEIVDAPDPHAAAARAVALVHEGKAQALMKGNLHTDELLREVVKADGGLRTSRRISHVFAMDVPGIDELVMITDAAINIAPDLKTKVDIVQNAIDLAHALGIPKPRVAILSAVETINMAIPSTMDAAILSKMAERGQIKGGIVDGPLAMDNAVDLEAAKTKGITSLVAGRAQVLVAPNLESGNMLAKEMTFVAQAEAAGLVLGAKVPIVLTSRADNEEARRASCVLAVLYEAWQRTGRSAVPAAGGDPTA
jgi:phosphate butyryltransferase